MAAYPRSLPGAIECCLYALMNDVCEPFGIDATLHCSSIVIELLIERSLTTFLTALQGDEKRARTILDLTFDINQMASLLARGYPDQTKASFLLLICSDDEASVRRLLSRGSSLVAAGVADIRRYCKAARKLYAELPR